MELVYPDICKLLKNNAKLLPFPGLNPEYVLADSYRDPQLTAKFFVYQQQDDIYYHPFHIRKIPHTSYNEIISAYGYGGPIATTHDSHFLADAFINYKSWCKEKNIIAETIRFHPLSQNWHFYQGLSIAIKHTVYVDLRNVDLMNSYESSARWSIRKALKNDVKCKLVDADLFLRIFPTLYSKRMNEINAKDFYYFNQDYFNSLCRMDNVLRLIALHNDEVIGAAFMLLEDKIMEYHLSANNNKGKQLQAMNLILHEAFLYAQSRGCHAAHLGGGTTANAADPLYLFKLSFAGQLAEYRIGTYIHNQQIYDELISQKLLEVR